MLTDDKFFLYKIADNGFTLILGLFVIPFFAIGLNAYSDTLFYTIVLVMGGVIVPISSIIGMNLKQKFGMVLRIIFTIIASVMVIFSQALLVTRIFDHSNSKSSYNYSSYTSDTNDYSNVEEIAGITLNVPDYFDVKENNYEGFDVAYYPETELAKATLGFKITMEDVTSEMVKLAKENIVNNWKEAFGENIIIDDYDIDGNYVLTMSYNENGILDKCASIVNDSEKKAIIVVLTVDPDDVSGYDYANDFDKMIKNAKISKKSSKVSETTNSFVNNQNDNSSVVDNTKETTKTNIENSDVKNAISDYNNEIDKVKNELNDEIDKAAKEIKEEMGVAGKLFGGYVDDYVDTYKDYVNDFSDIYKDTANEYEKIYDDLLNQLGY